MPNGRRIRAELARISVELTSNRVEYRSGPLREGRGARNHPKTTKSRPERTRKSEIPARPGGLKKTTASLHVIKQLPPKELTKLHAWPVSGPLLVRPCIADKRELHVSSHGGGTNGGGQSERENPGFLGSGRPGPPGPPKSRIFPLNLTPPVSATPFKRTPGSF